jgi:hypothetical protein
LEGCTTYKFRGGEKPDEEEQAEEKEGGSQGRTASTHHHAEKEELARAAPESNRDISNSRDAGAEKESAAVSDFANRPSREDEITRELASVTYLAVHADGSTTELGAITGYRVLYRQNGRPRRSKPFGLMYQAIGFQRGLRMGQASKIVPVYSKQK